MVSKQMAFSIEAMFEWCNALLHQMEIPDAREVERDIQTMGQVIKEVLGVVWDDYSFSIEVIQRVAGLLVGIYRHGFEY